MRGNYTEGRPNRPWREYSPGPGSTVQADPLNRHSVPPVYPGIGCRIALCRRRDADWRFSPQTAIACNFNCNSQHTACFSDRKHKFSGHCRCAGNACLRCVFYGRCRCVRQAAVRLSKNAALIKRGPSNPAADGCWPKFLLTSRQFYYIFLKKHENSINSKLGAVRGDFH